MGFLDTLFTVYRNKGVNFTQMLILTFTVDTVIFKEIENNIEIMKGIF